MKKFKGKCAEAGEIIRMAIYVFQLVLVVLLCAFVDWCEHQKSEAIKQPQTQAKVPINRDTGLFGLFVRP